jgi:hypothetical protein
VLALTESIAEGLAATANVLSGLGQAGRGLMAQVFVRPLLVARATVDPLNWDLSLLPSGTVRNDVSVLGTYLWVRLEPDNPDRFLANITRPLSAYPIPTALVDSIVAGLERTVNARSVFRVTFTRDLLLSLTPQTFAQFLADWRLLRFRQDPERIADEALATPTAP